MNNFKKRTFLFAFILNILVAQSMHFAQYEESSIVAQQKEKSSKIQSENDKIEFKNTSGNSILTITDEGSDAAAITLPDVETQLNGTKLYNNGGNLFWGNNSITNPSSDDWELAGDDLYSKPTGNVGIGVTNPSSKLEVNGNTKTATATIGSNGVTIQDLVFIEGNLSGSSSTAISYPEGFNALNTHVLSYKTRSTATDRWYAPNEGDYVYLRQNDILLLHATGFNTAYQLMIIRVN